VTRDVLPGFPGDLELLLNPSGGNIIQKYISKTQISVQSNNWKLRYGIFFFFFLCHMGYFYKNWHTPLQNDEMTIFAALKRGHFLSLKIKIHQ